MGRASNLKKEERQQQSDPSSSSDGDAAGSGDVVANILARLPFRTLVQCSTVCRWWRELTHSSYVRRASLARDRPWLLLHKLGWSRHGQDCLVAYSPAGGSWFELGSLHLLRSGVADHVASAAGLVCCVYRQPLSRRAFAVVNPLAISSFSSNRLLFLDSSITAFEAVAMWGTDPCSSSYGMLVAGPRGPSWEVCVFDSSSGSWTRSRTEIRGWSRSRSLLCSVVAAAGDDDRGLFCIWGGTRSVPPIITCYSIGLGSWTMLHDFFPFSWHCVAIRVGKRRFAVHVCPNLLDCGGGLVSISLKDGTLQVWQLAMNPPGQNARWMELSAMPEETWNTCSPEIGSSSSSSSNNEECSLPVTVTAVGGRDLVYVSLEWGCKVRVLLHSLRSCSWEWLPEHDERFNSMLCFDPKLP